MEPRDSSHFRTHARWGWTGYTAHVDVNEILRKHQLEELAPTAQARSAPTSPVGGELWSRCVTSPHQSPEHSQPGSENALPTTGRSSAEGAHRAPEVWLLSLPHRPAAGSEVRPSLVPAAGGWPRVALRWCHSVRGWVSSCRVWGRMGVGCYSCFGLALLPRCLSGPRRPPRSRREGQRRGGLRTG